ncbi:GAF domain-containing protein [Streptomyces sp. NPDC051896]|uniref:GAF domain-containing protein n=1 Tax=Streptomyces sp. NPDC051896 TaxID=3155416 RepID=UPI00343C1C66
MSTAHLPPLAGAEALDHFQEGLQQLAHAHGRLRSLLDAVLTISSALELEVVLHTIVDSARNLVDARYAAIGVLDEDGDFTELITAGFGADQLRQDAGAELPHGTGLLGELVRHPQPLRVENLAADPRAAGFTEGHPVMTPLLGVPIRVRSIVYGSLYLADKRSGAFTDDDQEILTALAGAAPAWPSRTPASTSACARPPRSSSAACCPPSPHCPTWNRRPATSPPAMPRAPAAAPPRRDPARPARRPHGHRGRRPPGAPRGRR